MLRRVAFSSLAFLVLPHGVRAQGAVPSPGTASEKAAFEAELAKLKDTPRELEKAKRVFTLAAELLLGRLGYGVGPYDGILDDETAAALRAYEKARSLPVTGNPMAFETMEAVSADDKALAQQPPYLPQRRVDVGFWASGYVVAVGTWTISGEEQGFPQQTSKLQCRRETGTCIEATAILSDNGGLSVDIDTYEIERWDEHELVTKPLEVGFGCVRYVKRISRLQQTASGIRSTISDQALCKDVDRSEKHLSLADGFKVYWDLNESFQSKRRQLMLISPELFSDPPRP